MDVEEERKAYDKAKQAFTGDTGYFDVWLAAKEHAVEMAKPTGRIKESLQTGWWVYYGIYQYGGIESKEAAEKWLTDRGYRVIE